MRVADRIGGRGCKQPPCSASSPASKRGDLDVVLRHANTPGSCILESVSRTRYPGPGIGAPEPVSWHLGSRHQTRYPDTVSWHRDFGTVHTLSWHRGSHPFRVLPLRIRAPGTTDPPSFLFGSILALASKHLSRRLAATVPAGFGARLRCQNTFPR